MWKQLSVLSTLVLLGTVAAWQQAASNAQEPPPAAAAKIPEEAAKQVNPVKATPASLAHIKKLYGYDCAMCHGKDGDGKGDLADSMKLQLKDWRDAASLKDVTDGELFYIISKGRGKMPAGAEQMKPEEIWNMVIYVRSFADKSATAKAKE
jgi:mono/diheme cytochrome c family protein